MNIIASFVIALLIGLGLLWGINQIPKDGNFAVKKMKFMEACLQDRKKYECDALWGQASRGQ